MYKSKLMKEMKTIINNIVETIVRNVHPEKVILFGSYAWGSPTPNSDIDLLIVVKSSMRRDKRSLEIYRLFTDRTFPLDIIVYTPEEVELCQTMHGSFVKSIMEEGKVLYDRPA